MGLSIVRLWSDPRVKLVTLAVILMLEATLGDGCFHAG